MTAIRALLAILIALAATPAEAGCRLALALALDVSGSVDDSEYVLQLNGIAEALGGTLAGSLQSVGIDMN